MVFKPGILFSLVCQGLLVCIAAAAGDSSYTWPNGNFRYLVPFKQGGGSASIAQLHETWFNDPAVNAWQGSTPYEAEMDYVPAESGAAGWRQVKEHPKDGSVITLINLPHIFLQPRLPSVVSDKVIPAGYSEDDIEIAYIHTYTPLVLAVPIDSPILNWADFVAACAAREISVSGAGLGTVFEVGSLRLKRLTNIKFAYHSAGDGADTALTKTIDGVYDAVWTTTPVVLGAHASKIRVIAIAAEFEFAQIEAPTFKTLGINFVEGIYRGVGVPAGTPPHIVKGISDTFNRLNRNRDFISEVASSGATQTFMQFDSQSLNQFLPSYKAQVLNTLFPPNAISPGSIYAFFLLGGLGLLATLGAAAFAFIYQNTPLIKGSSYFFNNVIIVGLLLAYSSMIAISFQEPLESASQRTIDIGCKSLPWLLGLGFDITFSAIIMKSYRLYRIFLFSSSRVIQYNGSNLAIMQWVLAICGINAIVYIVWTAYDPLTATMISLDGGNNFYYACQSRNTQVFIGVVLGLKYAMLSACIFFSLKLKDLTSMLNESKAIAAASFCTTFILTICLAVYALVNSFAGRYIIMCGGIFIGTSCVLVSLFGAKISIVVFAPDHNTSAYVKKLAASDSRSKSYSDAQFVRSGQALGSPTTREGSMDLRSNMSGRGSIDFLASTGSPNRDRYDVPFYVTEGKPFGKEHQDKINNICRVIRSAAGAGQVSAFHHNVNKLAKFAARFKVLGQLSQGGKSFSTQGKSAPPLSPMRAAPADPIEEEIKAKDLENEKDDVEKEDV